MDIRTAAQILRTLLEGVDPETGEILPQEHLVHEEPVQQALALVLEAVGAPRETAWVNKNGRLNAGRPWTPEDLAELRTLYEGGVSIEEIARLTQRRPRGVRLQLNLMAGGGSRRSERVLIPDQITPETAPQMPETASSYQPWTDEQDKHLMKLHEEHWRIAEIARTFGRSQGAIRSRLKKLGLIEPAPMGASSPASPPPAAPSSPAVSPSRRWTQEDDDHLRRAWREGTPIGEIAAALGRRDRLIRCRLVFLDIADPSILDGKVLPPELAHQGLPWYPEEIETLQSMFRQGRSPEDMAAALRRSADVVRNRMTLIGLTDSPAD